jgi:hypothetical protein
MRVFFIVKYEEDVLSGAGVGKEKRGGKGSNLAVDPAPVCTVQPSAVGTIRETAEEKLARATLSTISFCFCSQVAFVFDLLLILILML